MPKKTKHFSLIDFFKKKSIKPTLVEQEEPLQYNEIIITEQDMISLRSMVLTAKRQGNFYVGEVVTVETDGYITGKIVAVDGVIKGRVMGSITCTGELRIASTAIIEGTAIAKSVIIEAGSIINGTLSLTDEVPASVLTEKLKVAEILLSNGHIPEIETIEMPVAAVPRPSVATVPRPEETINPLKKKVNEQKNVKVKSKTITESDQSSVSGDEQAGSWW